MGEEIERKFLVASDGWRSAAGSGTALRQGYLSTDPDRTVRVRIAGDQARLTVKGRARGAKRAEFEYPIPVDDAREMLDTLCAGRIVEKRRYRVPVGAHVWEVDEFSGANAGLIMAEIEVASEQKLEAALRVRPDWVGRDVTSDGRLSNAGLAETPLERWDVSERAELGVPQDPV